jgi:predicted nucleic acid-binding protein
MIYLDTGCLVKLYYPEPESPKVATLVAGKPICFNALHELEFTNALHLKLFHRGATPAQVRAAAALVEADLKSGVLLAAEAYWEKTLRAATNLARTYSSSIGCRSLDVIHCAVASVLQAGEFLSTDVRQKQLAAAMGLNLVAF